MSVPRALPPLAPVGGTVAGTGGLHRRQLAIAFATAAVFVGWSVAIPASDNVRLVVSNLFQIGTATWAGVACLRRARSMTGLYRISWKTIGTGSLLFALGQVSWMVTKFGSTDAGSSPTADAISMASLAILLAGIVIHLGAPVTGWARLRLVSEALLLATSAFVVLWPSVPKDGITFDGSDGVAGLVALAYPVFDIILISVIVLVYTRSPKDSVVPIGLVATGLLLFVCSDAAMAIAIQSGEYRSGALSNVGWILGSGLIASGAGWPTNVGSANSGWWTWRQRVAPHVPSAIVLLALTSAAFSLAASAHVDRVVLSAVLVLLGLTTIQKVSATIEEHALGEWLENRVAERTHELDTQANTLRALTDQLAVAANIDQLTGLANRRRLLEELDALNGTDTAGSWLLMIDIDEFKSVNDRGGHGAGDDALRLLAHRLGACLGPGELLVRLGGDEFAVLICNPSTSEPPTGTCRSIVESVSRPLILHAAHYRVGASIGIARIPADDPSIALRDADIAMYEAKRAGKSTWKLYEPDMHTAAVRRASLDSEIRAGIARDEFVLHFQPIVSIKTKAIIGVEALVRWEHPRLGLLQPGDFIGEAERSGAIIPLGNWVAARACATLRTWQDRAMVPAKFTMSINVATVQLAEAAYVEDLARVIEEAGIDPASLQLEVVESAELSDGEAVMNRLLGAHDLGISLAIDDFGTGYSSFDYLRRGIFDVIKLDRSLLPSNDDTNDWAVVEAVLAVAGALDLDIVVEGVEDAAQAGHLEWLGFTKAQGFHYHRPMPAAAMVHFLEAQQLTDGQTVERRLQHTEHIDA